MQQHGVAEQRFGLVQFARIDVGLPSIAGAIDEEGGFRLLQRRSESGDIVVVEIGARQCAKRNAERLQHALVRTTDIAAGAKDPNGLRHKIELESGASVGCSTERQKRRPYQGGQRLMSKEKKSTPP